MVVNSHRFGLLKNCVLNERQHTKNKSGLKWGDLSTLGWSLSRVTLKVQMVFQRMFCLSLPVQGSFKANSFINYWCSGLSKHVLSGITKVLSNITSAMVFQSQSCLLLPMQWSFKASSVFCYSAVVLQSKYCLLLPVQWSFKANSVCYYQCTGLFKASSVCYYWCSGLSKQVLFDITSAMVFQSKFCLLLSVHWSFKASPVCYYQCSGLSKQVLYAITSAMVFQSKFCLLLPVQWSFKASLLYYWQSPLWCYQCNGLSKQSLSAITSAMVLQSNSSLVLPKSSLILPVQRSFKASSVITGAVVCQSKSSLVLPVQGPYGCSGLSKRVLSNTTPFINGPLKWILLNDGNWILWPTWRWELPGMTKTC